MYRAIAYCSLAFATLFSALIGIAIFILPAQFAVPDAGFVRAIFLVALAAAALQPLPALLGLTVLIPLFGNRPGSDQAWLLSIVCAAIQIAIAPRLVHLLKHNGQDIFSPAPLRWFAALLAVSCISLLALPLGELWGEIAKMRLPLADYESYAQQIINVARSREEQILYSPLSVLWCALGFNLALFMAGAVRRQPGFESRFLIAGLSGLVLSLIAGLLDYYALIDLRPLRSLDPVVNPGDVQFRLQSFFGHSGWYAEYVTLSIPFAMALLLLPLSFWVRVVLVLGILLVGEFTLILTFQRGGWLSYPLSLIAIWAALYVTRQFERGTSDVWQALRISALKICLSLPLTIALSIGGLWALSRAQVLPPGVQFSLDSYAQRLRDVSKTSDRSEFIHAAMLLTYRNPFGGWGAESFAYAYRREFLQPDGAYYQRINLPLHGSAHNVYAQVAAGRGLAGLLCLLALLASLVRIGFSAACTQRSIGYHQRLALLTGASSAVAFAIYGIVQEIFYIQVLGILFSLVSGVTCGVQMNTAVDPPRRNVWMLLVIALCGLHAAWVFVYPGRTSADLMVKHDFGCYGQEATADGAQFRWCAPRASLTLPVSCEQGSATLRFTIVAGPNQSSVQHPTLQISLSNGLQSELPLAPGKRTALTIPLASNECQGSRQGAIRAHFKTASHFIPAWQTPNSLDTRVLSFQILMP